MNEKEIVLDIHGREYRVIIDAFTSEEAEVRVNGKKYTVGLTDLGMEKTPDVKPRPVPAASGSPKAAGTKARTHRPPSLGQENAITAPLPGHALRC